MSTIWSILSTAWSVGGTHGLAAIGGGVVAWYVQRRWYPTIKTEVQTIESVLPKL